eukprot:2588208-Prymnesium_polylepis.2
MGVVVRSGGGVRPIAAAAAACARLLLRLSLLLTRLVSLLDGLLFAEDRRRQLVRGDVFGRAQRRQPRRVLDRRAAVDAHLPNARQPNGGARGRVSNLQRGWAAVGSARRRACRRSVQTGYADHKRTCDMFACSCTCT